MSLIDCMFRLGSSRMVRRGTAVVVLAIYLLAGALHGVCGIDVAHAGGGQTMSNHVKDDSRHAEQSLVPDAHCHGCFPVFISAPPTAGTVMAPVLRSVAVLDLNLRILPPGVDTPPPKA